MWSCISEVGNQPQPEPKTIAEVLQSVEARQFWERVYIKALPIDDKFVVNKIDNLGAESIGELGAGDWAKMYADTALRHWQERFGPKAAE